MKNIPELDLNEDNVSLLREAIDAAGESCKEIILIDLFKTPLGDTITVNPLDFGESIIEVRVKRGVTRFTLNELKEKMSNE